jgi:hypothetical protein
LKGYDLIVIGSGAAGMTSAIRAGRDGKNVLLLEKLPKLGAKLKATGGGKCNLTNSLENEEFMLHFGKNGRFMTSALELLNYQKLIDFFLEIGVECHIPDGRRVFPVTHSSDTIVLALIDELKRLEVSVLCSQRVEKLNLKEAKITGVDTEKESFISPNVIIATGGLGYATLGSDGDGYKLANSLGHKITALFPAMMPLKVSQSWVASCRADTIAKVELRIDLPKTKKFRAVGDLIFTKDGIRGPVVLDFAREITPLLEQHGKVPLLVNLTKGMNEDEIRVHFKKNHKNSIFESICLILPKSISLEFFKLCNIEQNEKFNKISGENRDKLIKMLAWTPLTVIGCDGYKKAMITRGGISLKEIDPKTMQSKLIKGLYFCGEVVDLDGPCGGYNLQWSFASGYLAGGLYQIK